jgi:uncharacterized protein (DUF342 family)
MGKSKKSNIFCPRISAEPKICVMGLGEERGRMETGYVGFLEGILAALERLKERIDELMKHTKNFLSRLVPFRHRELGERDKQKSSRAH